MKYISLIVILVVFGTSSYSGRQLPSTITKCKAKDSHFNVCLKSVLQDLSKELAKGVKELKLPPIDPYVIPELQVQTSWMNGTFTNIGVYNIDKYIVTDVEIDDGKAILLKIDVPYLDTEFKYRIDGKLVQLNFIGEGNADARFSDVAAAIRVDYKKVQKHGKTYLDVEDVEFKVVKIKAEKIYFHNLFSNNPELTKQFNGVILENQEVLLGELYPIAEKIAKPMFLSILKAVFDEYSISELYN
ncbi:hypothetical protein Trydic_g499 [Trypoxylus dichotomus]